MRTILKTNTLRSLLAIGSMALAGLGVAAENPHDPYENFNRTMYTVNKTLDTYVTRPVAQAYDASVPLPAKAGVGNFFGNLGEAWVGANSLMQGKPGDAGDSLARMLVNSTVGIFGLFDVASELGIERCVIDRTQRDNMQLDDQRGCRPAVGHLRPAALALWPGGAGH